MRHFAMLWTILLCAAPSCVPAVANPLNTWIDASNQVTAALPFATTSMEEEASTILHVAMFEAMNTISRAYRPYHFSATVPTACDEEAAA